MRTNNTIFCFVVLAVFQTSCATAPIVPSGESGALESDPQASPVPQVSPVPAEEVKIYRSTLPENQEVEDLGSIRLTGINPRLQVIYEDLRAEAASKGAHYVVDFKLQVQNESRTPNANLCASGVGGCNSIAHTMNFLSYVATGKLLKRK